MPDRNRKHNTEPEKKLAAKVSLPAGYPGKLLIDKLGLKKGAAAFFINTPADYSSILGLGIEISQTKSASRLKGEADFLHYFTLNMKDLVHDFLKSILPKTGCCGYHGQKKPPKYQLM